jgi:hypothetical protein
LRNTQFAGPGEPQSENACGFLFGPIRKYRAGAPISRSCPESPSNYRPQSRPASSATAYFADKTTIKRDEIAARQLHALKQHLRSTDKELKMTDVREMFRQMRDC